MTMDQEARDLVRQLANALLPLKVGGFTQQQTTQPDGETWGVFDLKLGQARAANAAIAAASAALASTAGQ